MSFQHTPPTDNAADGSRRVTWPEVAVLIAALGFDIFLMSRGLSVRDATITTVTTTASVLSLLLLPRRVTEALRLLRAISRSVNPPGPGGA
jgi:hypothetical protein